MKPEFPDAMGDFSACGKNAVTRMICTRLRFMDDFADQTAIGDDRHREGRRTAGAYRARLLRIGVHVPENAADEDIGKEGGAEVFPDFTTAIFDSKEAIPIYNKGKKRPRIIYGFGLRRPMRIRHLYRIRLKMAGHGLKSQEADSASCSAAY